MMNDRLDIVGSSLLTDVFGYWPGFHDAEVRSMELNVTDDCSTGPDLTVQIYVFEMTDEISSTGHYVLRKHTLVTMRFRGVDNVQIGGFNKQNALMGMSIQDVRSRQMENVRFEVCFDAAWGVDASFVCREVVVEKVQPWDAERRCAVEHGAGPDEHSAPGNQR
jgi:hypothetical protein